MKKKKLKGKVQYIVPIIVLALLVLVGALAAQHLAGSSSAESALRALRSLRLIATVVTCFSMASMSILWFGGAYRERVLHTHRNFVAFLLSLSFASSFVAFLMCVLVPVWGGGAGVVSILGVVAVLLISSVVVSIALVNGAFDWNGNRVVWN